MSTSNALPLEAEPDTPMRGEIWVVCASAVLPVLQAVAACSAGGLSVAMQTEISRLEGAGPALPHRPCVIVNVHAEEDTFDIVAFTTLKRGRTHVSEMNLHFQHFALSVGGTPAWPTAASWVLQPQPYWPTIPQYAAACLMAVPRSSILHRYKKRNGTSHTLYDCEERALMRLQRICVENIAAYLAITPEQRKAWDLSYEITLDKERRSRDDAAEASTASVLNPAADEFVPQRGMSEFVYAQHALPWAGSVACNPALNPRAPLFTPNAPPGRDSASRSPYCDRSDAPGRALEAAIDTDPAFGEDVNKLHPESLPALDESPYPPNVEDSSPTRSEIPANLVSGTPLNRRDLPIRSTMFTTTGPSHGVTRFGSPVGPLSRMAQGLAAHAFRGETLDGVAAMSGPTDFRSFLLRNIGKSFTPARTAV